ncbi:MAG: amidohydrolase family protein [Candidatus Synoicihabitans palmerolidicus]|nr:amidohydrolase family protein [Candidatus Synoicihabitans palmerolidicus]
MTRILDSHIHAYPSEVFANPRAWGETHGEPWWTESVAPLDRPSIQGWADLNQLLRDMDHAGIEQVVMLGWYWQQPSTCELQNQWFLEWHHLHPDRIKAFATVQPAAGPRGLDNVRRCLDAGLLGIGELRPQIQGFSLADDSFAALAQLAATREVPINLHVTDPTLDGRPGAIATPLADYVFAAQSFPDTTFILAHWGGGLPFHELTPRVARALRNVYYDTAASPLLYRIEVFRRVVNLIGADRILFGSDYPLRLYPRTESAPGFERFLNDIRHAGLSSAELDAIMGDNLRRLLRLP